MTMSLAQNTINASSNMAFAEEHNMLKGLQLHYFDRSRHINDLPGLYQDIISSATQSVYIFDPYFNLGDELIFSSLQYSVDIIVLRMYPTGSGSQLAPRDCVTHIINAIPNSVKSIGHGNVQCVYINTNNTATDPFKFHDRYLIIDRAIVYSVGASVGYQLRPKQSFGMIELDDPDDAAIVLDVFDRYKTEAESRGYSFSDTY